jgi:hypothetical protein
MGGERSDERATCDNTHTDEPSTLHGMQDGNIVREAQWVLRLAHLAASFWFAACDSAATAVLS